MPTFAFQMRTALLTVNYSADDFLFWEFSMYLNIKIVPEMVKKN